MGETFGTNDCRLGNRICAVDKNPSRARPTPMRRRVALVLVFLLLSSRPGWVLAADGYFDPTWAGAGRFTFAGDYNNPGLSSAVNSIAVESDGNLFLGGSVYTSPNNYWWLGELFPNGQFVQTFGLSDGSGRFTPCQYHIACGTSTLGALGVAVSEPDGTYLGLSINNVFQVDFETSSLNLQLDQAIAVNNVQGLVIANAAMALLPNGKVLAGGSGQYNGTTNTVNRFGIVRLNSNLNLDTTFNAITDGNDVTFAGGAVIPVVPTDTSEAVTTILLQPDGKIVLVGTGLSSASVFQLEAVRLTANGALDTTFGSGGMTAQLWSLGSINTVGKAILDRAGRIVVPMTGTTTVFPLEGMLVARLNPNGSPDTSFAGTGFEFSEYSSQCDSMDADALAMDSAGRIIVVGDCLQYSSDTAPFAVLRLRGDTGAVDTSFGVSGYGLGSFTDKYNYATSVVFDQGGRPIVGGGTSTEFMGSAGISRLTYDLLFTNNFETTPRGCLPPDCN